MSQPAALVPPSVSARAQSSGRLAVAFGRRFFLLLAVGLVWVGPAWWEPQFLWGIALWDAAVIAFWAWDLRRLPPPEQLELRRNWSRPVELASAGSVEIELRNHGGRAVLAQVLDDVPAALRRELPLLAITVSAGGTGRASYDVEPRERGDVRVGDAWVRYSSRLLLAERRAHAVLGQLVRVYPSLEESKRHTIYLIRSRQIELERRVRRQRGHGREFESLREYRQGDEWRDICWTATARRGKLISKVYQIERSQTLWLVLDAGRLLRARVAGLSKLDYAVNAALSLAQVAFFSGDRVALLAYGRKVQQRLAPGRGTAHLRAIVESLALVRGEGFEADHLRAAEALLASQKRRCLVVWLTDLTETATTPEVIESASRMAHRHLVLFAVIGQPELRELAAQRPERLAQMYRSVAAQEVIQERDLLLGRLRQQGALALEIEPARLATALVNRYLEVKECSLL